MYFPLAVGTFFLPGLAISALFGYRDSWFLNSLLFSYVVLIVSRYLGEWIDLTSLPVYFLWISIAIIVGTIVRCKSQWRTLLSRGRWAVSQALISIAEPYTLILISASLAACAGIWILGPYSEIPADVWQHLENIRKERVHLEQGAILGSNIWYLVQAYLWSLSQTGFESYLERASFFHTLVFLIGIGAFSKNLAIEAGISITTARGIGLCSIVCAFVFFGMGVFAYVRYYTFSPAFFVYILYLSSLVHAAKIISPRGVGKTKKSLSVLAYSLCLVVAFVIHKQEALFILLVSFIIVGWGVVVTYSRGSVTGLDLFAPIKMTETLRVSLIITILVTVISVVMLASGFIGAVTQPRKLHPDLFHLGILSRAFLGFYIVNPFGQFFQAIGNFGIIVLFSWLLTWRYSRVSSLLTCTILAVFMSLFNPAFCAFFLKMTGAEVLWRLTYLVPFFTIGGFVIVNNVSNMLEKKYIKVNQGFAVALLLIVPFSVTVFDNGAMPILGDSKLWTLAPTATRNNHKHWDDLISRLNQINGRKNILTDPITGYVLSATTKHSHARWKFHKIDYIEFNKPGYSKRSFEDYAGWLLVVNRRDGDLSFTGRESGHWPVDIMQVSKHYEEEFLDFVRSSPRFKLIWIQGEIEIYEIS
jgi:hypothetical protein